MWIRKKDKERTKVGKKPVDVNISRNTSNVNKPRQKRMGVRERRSIDKGGNR